MFELLPIGIYRSSPSGRMIRANRALQRLNGFDTEVELIAAFNDLASEWYVDPNRRQVFKDGIERDGHIAGFVSEIYRHKTHERLWIREYAHVVRDADGIPLFYEGTVEDITESLRTRNALQESEALLRSITSQVPGMVFRIVIEPGRPGQYTFVSEGVRQLFEVEPEAAMANSAALRNLRHPDDRAWVDRQILDAIEGSLPLSIEFRILLPDARVKWVGMVSTAAPDVGDARVRVGVMLDITDRKLAENELSQRERLLATLTSSIPSMIAYWDRDCICRFANPSYLRRFGRTQQQMVGAAMHEIMDADTLESNRTRFALALQGQNQRFEGSIRQPDGREVHVINEYIADFSEGKVDGFVLLVSDITEIKARQLETERLNRELEHTTGLASEASVAKSRFLANMSHEIRTPMNAVLGMLALIGQTEVSAQQSDYVGKARTAATSLLGLLNDILDLSKVESGKMELDLQPRSLEAVLRDVAALLSSFVGAKNVDVMLDVDLSLPDCLVFDAHRLQQVLINLASNAIKFTPSGHVVVQVRQARSNPDTVDVEFSVRDSGIGIAAEVQTQLFTDFMQAEVSTTRKYGGTGLGLAISQRLVALMGGRIAVDSAPGAGSRFTWTLQMQRPQQGDAAATPNCLQIAQSRPRATLIVDDNPVAQGILAATVRAWGWPVTTAADANEALQLLQHAQAGGAAAYDLVLIDWQLEQGGALALARFLIHNRAQQDGQQPRVVLLSGHAPEHLTAGLQWIGGEAFTFLTKPMTPAMLCEAALGTCKRTSSLPPAAGSRRLAGMRILVVEDNPINQQVAIELLSLEGAWVALAENGQLGVDAVACADPPFDVVLMDLQMPVMDGYAATRAIRRHPTGAQLPIVAMTANAMPSDRSECLASGMNEHVGKPFDIHHLVRLLCGLTGRSSALPAVQEPVAVPEKGVLQGQLGGIAVGEALQRMSGSRSLYIRSARGFMDMLDGMPAQFQSALAGDRSGATLQMHTLKGTAALLGARDLSRLAQTLEALCRADADGAEINAQAAHLGALTFQTRQALEHVVRRLEYEEHAVMASAQSKAVTANMPELQDGLDEVMRLLQASDLSVISRLEVLRPQLQAVLADQVEPLYAAMQTLDLARALEVCRGMQQVLASQTL